MIVAFAALGIMRTKPVTLVVVSVVVLATACWSNSISTSLSEREALDFAAQELCPSSPETFSPDLRAAFDSGLWRVFVGDYMSEIVFMIQAERAPSGPVLTPQTDAAETFLKSSRAACDA
jgi:hypothetical protein